MMSKQKLNRFEEGAMAMMNGGVSDEEGTRVVSVITTMYRKILSFGLGSLPSPLPEVTTH